MRRFVTAALLALFICQSSGAAQAAPAVVSNAAQAMSSLQTTQIGALVTGKESQYEATHQGPPNFTEARKPHPHPNPDWHSPRVVPVFRQGVPVPLHLAGNRAGGFRITPAPRRAPGSVPSATHSATTMTVGAGNGTGTTGINPWWSYEQGAVPGAGTWMVNVSTGNLIVQEDDVDISERGIDLAFRMTYNSQSQHDYNNTDGSIPDLYGNGWTNTFDAHAAYANNDQTLVIYDVDGARYDYTANGQGGWNPPPGMEGTRIYSDGSGCGFFWEKKSGTRYDFSWPNYCNGSPSTAGLDGVLYEIQGRNRNNWIRLDRYFVNGDASSLKNLTQINAVHADGQVLTLKFGSFSNYTELASITRPDGAQITYSYDTSGDLTWVTKPGNNTNATLQDAYGYWSGYPHRLNWAASPAWTLSGNTQGGYNWFDYNGSGFISGVQLYGWGNFTPADGTGLALQPALPQQHQQLNYTSFAYPSSGETQLTDAYGRGANWFYDGAGRVTEEDDFTGTNNTWLHTYTSWDPSKNVPTETVDARGNATDYGWDDNANLVWVQEPPVQTSQGGGRPVARFTYDQYNNLLSYCDPQYVWTYGVASCPVTGGTAHYTWSFEAGTSDDARAVNEPFGRLTDIYNAQGYHRWLLYNTSSGGMDYGLVTDAYGDPVRQDDGTIRSPHVSVVYDPDGNVTSSNNGVGTWTATYDNLNRPTSATDPDGAKTCTWYYGVV